jgi:lipid II:glycine glycyltransferase (peptidoglycan interpeptide bridge formation enzyme)
MKVQDIDGDTFNEFASKHILKNFFQTKEYGEIMRHSEFSVRYIGGFVNNEIVAASLILYKSIAPSIKYGYAPRGFLINYYDTELLKEWTKKLKDFFFSKGYAFIKINPEVTFATVNFDEKTKVINSKSEELIKILRECGYDKLKDNLYFESLLPKYTPVINLPTYEFDKLDPKLIEKINDYEDQGIYLLNGNENDIDTFYSFVENKNNKTVTYYKTVYKTFKASDKSDLLLANLDYSDYVKYLQRKYIEEQANNEKINEMFRNDSKNQELFNKKMESDKLLNDIEADIALGNQKMQESVLQEIYGAALIIRHEGRVSIIISGQKKDFRLLDTKTFIYYKIIEEYKKKGYLFIDLYGITGDFTENNPYKDLNDFKLKFKPTIYEYIGEFDLIVNKPIHQILWSTNKIQKEFYYK